MNKYSYSRLACFQACPRKFQYKYEMGYEPRWDGPPKPVGKAVHAGIEAFYTSTNDAVSAALAAWDAEVTPEVVEQLGVDEQESIERYRMVVEACVRAYVVKYTKDKFSDVHHVEQELETDMGHGRVLTGRVDRIVGGLNRSWIHDTKTTGLDIALVARAHMLRKQYPGYTLNARANGEMVSGVIMDFIRKPQAPRPLKAGGFGKMQDVLFHREWLPVTESDEQRFRKWFHAVCAMIEECSAYDDWPQNDGACLNFNRLCPYYDVCIEGKRAQQVLDGPRFQKATEGEDAED